MDGWRGVEGGGEKEKERERERERESVSSCNIMEGGGRGDVGLGWRIGLDWIGGGGREVCVGGGEVRKIFSEFARIRGSSGVELH